MFLKPWPKLNDRREWIFHSTLVGFSCTACATSGVRWMIWFSWFMVGITATLYLMQLYLDYLEEKISTSTPAARRGGT